MGGADGLPGPTDAWVTLGAIARETTAIRLGTLVTSATFRHPGPLAVTVAQVDEMSSGRVDFGLGAGWFSEEHEAYAIPFPSLGERFDRLEEQLEILTGLWTTPTGDTYSYAGKHYTVTDSPALPKPVQEPHPPIVIGGLGVKRTPALAARFAAEFNLPFQPVDVIADRYARVAQAVEAAGRPADSMVYSAAFAVCIGDTDTEIARRAANARREVEEITENSPLAGTPDAVAEKLSIYVDAGVQRVYVQLLDIRDLDHLEFFASTVIPQFS
ncbi:alkanesulfonate monooxygenase [Mycobacteroides abscessus subsp. massiliense]|nr:alkanesulfonate monooxygenase [Mycobacteroides abscessus subsp. massiliense]